MKMFGFKSSAFAFAAALALFAPVSAAFAQEKDSACCLKSGDCIDTDEKTCGEEGGSFDGQLTCKDVDCKGKGADCSPGYYKNHREEWCTTFDGASTPEPNDAYPGSDLSKPCASGADCISLHLALKAQGPGSSSIRAEAKAFLDGCFGSAEDSPCTDDD